MIYRIAEKFKSVQGEGLYTGTPMAFIRFVGCSVGKSICHHCDTDFDKEYGWLGGGVFDEAALLQWAGDYKHILLTGGEPLDQDLQPLFDLAQPDRQFHIETSGTVILPMFRRYRRPHVCVSPKPGFREDTVQSADEIKVIVPGLGNGEGWPNLTHALDWAKLGKPVFLQPRNAKHDVDNLNLVLCEKLVDENPSLRLSVQVHKLLRVR